MCGIVGAVAERNIVPILIEGLRRLEYRGYDSAGVAVIDAEGAIGLRRTTGKVAELEHKLDNDPLHGRIGVAHTRWATHGGVTESNAHPHLSGGRVAVIHNGIIENFQEIKDELLAKGYEFQSETDTEVAAHLVYDYLQGGDDLLGAVGKAVKRFKGAYALLVIDAEDPGRIVVSRVASPLVIGLGLGENFVASGAPALLPVTQRFIFLEQGDIAEIKREEVRIFDDRGELVEREVHETNWDAESAEKGPYRHYMLKEIFEQPSALADTLYGRINNHQVLPESLGPRAAEMLDRVEHIHIVACGTSYHAGCVGKYWIEALAGVPCQVEIASEYRYRQTVVPDNTLFVTLSQSGETADTLEALRMAKRSNYMGSLTICNSAHSSMVRESDLVMMTQAGPEIGVASTKAFTTQLLSVLLVTMMLARHRGMEAAQEREFVGHMYHAATASEQALKMSDDLKLLAEDFADKHHTLFLGRGPMWPIAMEGALKLKEISYIHAEAYAAGELKHGPLALIDEDMPVVVVAPNNELLDKLKSNMQVVRARGGQLYVFADQESGIEDEEGMTVIPMPHADRLIAPIVYTVPLQLLSYHVAVLRGTDVDQPRNLAKSVTVE
ncbi:MAG: glutamine--fructose-6-phosphate transaminase (isomerizing) [Gammaproteobacteria bacterium]|nr:glutamine--fructose-6-phosphate transaminase (isomerizing) [Gammaproteobacteria bacterium]NNF49236.1 glutamine--fructose-6-phosphate transaminase (isomerizing) [Woeseiaceae bacterium]MBT8093372.1 glutamine--fructose-6-phosphate transaminase (isomerizing) [Gammaproteobacteria bacterium]MBT8104087.1 glutamine--fructose-6-phosphate transaminase (isomerizing) [Gammaproteobacteria bacterium]NNK24102.1 glutamine--fructose-6-phosphate transaminase (isomerizing) [Woeseiaceae bacterium]